MRIGIDARFYGPRVGGGGIGRYVQELVTHLQATPSSHHFVLFLNKENFHECEITNPQFEKRLVDIPWYGLREQLDMPAHIRAAKVDLMHYPHWNIPLFSRTPFIVTVHDLILLEDRHSARSSANNRLIHGFKYAAFRMVLEAAIHSSKKIITVSNTSRDSILKHFGVYSNKVEVIHNGFKPLLPQKAASLRDLGVLEPYFLYVGNAYPHKNLEMLMHAFALFCKLHPYVQLVIAGRRDTFSRTLEKEARQIGIPADRLRFIDLPTDDEVAHLYQRASLFVYPSRLEGFGLPPLEALAHHVPVAAAESSSLPEILGNCANYFRPDDVERLVEIMQMAATNPEKLLPGAQKIQDQLAKYDWQVNAQKTMAIYDHFSPC